MKSTFSLLLSSLLLTSSLSFAAPSQLVFGDKSLTSSASRDPDFVDILESQSSFNDKLQELIQDAQELSKQVITESYSKIADLSNQAEIEALLIAASLEDKVMEILPHSQDGDHHDQNGITKELKSGLNHSKKPLKNDVSIPDLPNWGAFKNLNADTQLDAPSPPGGGWVWSSCGQSQDAVIVQDIKVTPDPPRPGQNLTVHAKGIVNSKLENGTYADVVVKLGLIKLLTRRFDVCEEAKKNDAQVQCPVAPGPYEIEQTVALPREIPPAKFNVHVTGGTQDDEDLLCLDLSINFMHRS